jgi:hypothetical protein
MTSPSADGRSIDIVDEFMSTGFEEEAGAAAWLVKKIAALEGRARSR